MVGRYSQPPNNSNNNNNGSTTRRRSRGHEERGGERENGGTRDDEGSDVDELVDSDSERAEQDALSRTRASAGRISSSSSTTRGRPRGAVNARSVSNRYGDRKSVDQPSPRPSQPPPQHHQQQQQTLPPTDRASGMSAQKNSGSSSSKTAATSGLPSSDTPKDHQSPQDHQSRNTSGGPYYFSQSANGAVAGVNDSPRNTALKKIVPGPSSQPDHNKSTAAAAANSSSKPDDLSLLEVDKFLDLIEKHNLHTSNEDDMARSVTELYQEWLEWCAKRNVQSTKSKQALVAEFVRIHQGNYGSTRQKRAMEIVQGSAGNAFVDSDGNGHAKLKGEVETESKRQSVPPHVPTSKGASARSISRSYKEEERETVQQQQQRIASNLMPNRSSGQSDAGLPSSHHIIQAPSPVIHSRGLTPVSVGGSHHLAEAQPTSLGISHSEMDHLYRQIRHDVWRDANTMITQVIQEQTSDLLAENNALRGRVDQLEIHSDNLAQWIQHLNRVQDDLNASIRTPAPPHPREEIIMEEKYQQHTPLVNNHQLSRDSSRMISSSTRDRPYASQYEMGPPSTHSSSPKRNYAIRRSPSPPIIAHHHSSSRRPAPQPPPPPPHQSRQFSKQQQPPPSPSGTKYRDHPRGITEIRYTPIHSQPGGGGDADHSRGIREIRYTPIHSQPGGDADQYERPYYTYPPDDREPPPLPISPRQVKRARNGY